MKYRLWSYVSDIINIMLSHYFTIARFISHWSEMLVTQSCLTLCNPMDCTLPGPSLHGILQARMLECIAMPSSRGSSPPRDQTQLSHISRHNTNILGVRLWYLIFWKLCVYIKYIKDNQSTLIFWVYLVESNTCGMRN